ncbi:MAG: Na+:solute symporter [Myxococcales bacterium]|nr:Na+:solute symporter [Myxococcales bacterium]
MKLAPLDISIVVGYVLLTLIAGLYLSRRATKSVEDYFVGGRTLPWWLAGTSMIASAFAIDTPLGIAGFVGKNGVQGVWFAWAYAIGGAGAFGAFVFAPLLRRSDIITTAELVELRYSGRDAAILRGFKGVYFGVIAIAIQMGWVIRSVLVLAQEAFGWDATPTLAAIIALTIIYTTASGFWGVAVTDFAQFFIGGFGSLALAIYAVRSAGGLGGVRAGLVKRLGAAEAERRLRFVPRPDDGFFKTFLVFITLKWWGNPPSSVNQRIMSTRDERHATFSQTLFAAVHFGINYWPMILVALVAIGRYPQLPLAKAEQGYALLLVNVLPTGMLGLMLASLTAAFMSTVDTQANTGASFMINDIYRRFIRREADSKHYVRASQVATVIMLALSVVVAYNMSSVKAAWEYLATLTAGYGFIAVARWFWWRISARAEIAALVGSGLGSIIAAALKPQLPSYGARFALVAAISTVMWVVVTLVSAPPPLEPLARFCRKVRPYPLGWGPVRERFPDIEWSAQLGRSVLMWIGGLAAILALNFGIGSALLGSGVVGATLLALAAVGALLLVRYFRP